MDSEHTPLSALSAAVTAYGSQSATARRRGVTQGAVWKWLNETKSLPAEHVLAVEADTGVSRHDLRPDIYPRDLPASADIVAGRVPATWVRPLPGRDTPDVSGQRLPTGQAGDRSTAHA